MAITPQDAAEALQLVSDSERRSIEFRGYQSMAPHLLMWGAIWLVGYASNYFVPALSNRIWWGLMIAGWSMSYGMTRRDRRHPPRKRIFGILLTFVIFTIASIIVMAPDKPHQVGAFIPMVVAVCYVIVGLYSMPRLVIAGVGIFVLTLVGYFALPGIFPLWMAVVGGGGLALGGFWLQRA